MEVAIKMVVVGNGAVGKSSMIQRYCKGIFTKDYKKTIGVDFLERQIQYVLGHFILWVLVCEQCPMTVSERRWLVTAQTLGVGRQRCSVTHSFVCPHRLSPPSSISPFPLSFFFFFATLLPSLFFSTYICFIFIGGTLGTFLKNFIDYLAVLGLSCGARTLVAARGLSCSVTCRPWFLDQGWARVPCAASRIVNHQATGTSHRGHFLDRK